VILGFLRAQTRGLLVPFVTHAVLVEVEAQELVSEAFFALPLTQPASRDTARCFAITACQSSRIFLSRCLLMLKRLFTALVCGFAIAGQMRAQEVVVTRDAKPNPSERVTLVSQGTGSESEAATEMKSQRHEKKSASSTLTLETHEQAVASSGDFWFHR
jgi:hypothetical protein